MSLLVNTMTFDQVVRAIREIVLDVNPVPAFNVSGQGFVFAKDSINLTVGETIKPLAEVPKLYDVIKLLRAKSPQIEFLPNYVATEYTKNLVDFNHAFPADVAESKAIEVENYFSIDIIEQIMVEFFSRYFDFNNRPRLVSEIYSDLDYMGQRKLAYWVAYWLVDRKRMNLASVEAMQNNGVVSGDVKSTTQEITTRVGEVFTVTERVEDGGAGTDNFTSFWGDKYSYYTKLQLWIRDRFEKQFMDFSLRDNQMISQTFTIEKAWAPYAYDRYSKHTRDIFLPPITE